MFLIGFSYWYKNIIGNNEKIKYNCLILLKKCMPSGSKCIFICHHISLLKPLVFLIVEMNFQTLWISNAGRDSALGRWHNCLCPCWLGLSQLLSTSVPLWQSNFHFPSVRHSVFSINAYEIRAVPKAWEGEQLTCEVTRSSFSRSVPDLTPGSGEVP